MLPGGPRSLVHSHPTGKEDELGSLVTDSKTGPVLSTAGLFGLHL